MYVHQLRSWCAPFLKTNQLIRLQAVHGDGRDDNPAVIIRMQSQRTRMQFSPQLQKSTYTTTSLCPEESWGHAGWIFWRCLGRLEHIYEVFTVTIKIYWIFEDVRYFLASVLTITSNKNSLFVAGNVRRSLKC